MSEKKTNKCHYFLQDKVSVMSGMIDMLEGIMYLPLGCDNFWTAIKKEYSGSESKQPCCLLFPTSENNPERFGRERSVRRRRLTGRGRHLYRKILHREWIGWLTGACRCLFQSGK